ncbi:uncharacterized protein LOC133898600 [Phragmites australis]|uniref:uncharacterized protein LOC133898600 n=1 Tax=Phragmites australis TaxID=29695 RepID=UPI002D77B36D|nr:uncharacterized protein LOC133898600 [Phragmites australis]
MEHILVDGGSSINLLFVEPLDGLQILRSELKPSPSFFGNTIDSSAKPSRQIKLPITFGLPNNFETEKVLFDVADFETTYNAVLGRSTMTQFMVIAYYAYQAIKIPGPKGAITILGNPKMALHCNKRSLGMVELTSRSQPENIELRGHLVKVQVITNLDDRLKAVFLNDVDPSRTV